MIIQTDQHRFRDLGCTGGAVLTPNVDRLADEGTLFERAYVANPLCMPSRASLLTGLTPRRHGVWTNGVPLASESRTIASELRDEGYSTALIGKAHLSPYGIEPRFTDDSSPEGFRDWANAGSDAVATPYFGFDHLRLVLGHNRPGGHYGEWLERHHPGAVELFDSEAGKPADTGAPQTWVSALPAEQHSTRWISDEFLAFLQERGQHDEPQPFFALLSFPDPHHPFAPPEPYASMYDPSDMPAPLRRPGELADKPPHFEAYWKGGVQHEGAFPDDVPSSLTDEQVREMTAKMYGMISFIDDAVGQILDGLAAAGELERTLIVFTTDHGELLGDHGLFLKGPFLYESLIRVPLIIRWPNHGPTSESSHRPVSQLDLVPTIRDVVGLDPDRRLTGRSLCRGSSAAGGRPADSCLVEYRSGYDPSLDLFVVITKRWKLVHYRGRIDGELYDLASDPSEFDNRFHDPGVGDIKLELLAALIDHLAHPEAALNDRTAHA